MRHFDASTQDNIITDLGYANLATIYLKTEGGAEVVYANTQLLILDIYAQGAWGYTMWEKVGISMTTGFVPRCIIHSRSHGLIPRNLIGYIKSEDRIEIYVCAEMFTSDLQIHADGVAISNRVEIHNGAPIISYAELRDDIVFFDNDSKGYCDNAGQHNSLYLGRDLTAYFDSGRMSAAIADGSFENIYPGDYIIKDVTVNGTLYENVKFIVGDCDYYYMRGDTPTNKHHVLMISESNIGTAKLHNAGTSTNYVASTMFGTTMPLYAAGIEAAFTDEDNNNHVLTHRENLANGFDDNMASMAGAGRTGASSGWNYQSVSVNIPSEVMLYGTHIAGSSFFDIGNCNRQIAAMRLNPSLDHVASQSCWTRTAVAAAVYATSDAQGHENIANVGTSLGVRPYFLLT